MGQAQVMVLLCALVHVTTRAAEVDHKRPYQFGFKLESQHREEKKDANGLVTGEYGFATADGFYETVQYATDAEGKYRILKRGRVRMVPPEPKVKPTAGTRERGVTEPTAEANSEAKAFGAAPVAEPATTTTTTTTTEKTMVYQFNYTALQHGRQEAGFSDTSKVGDYYWDGPDGYRRIVTYTADDRGGYRPTFKQVKLPVKKRN